MKYFILLLLILSACAPGAVLVKQDTCKLKYTLVDGHEVDECEEADAVK